MPLIHTSSMRTENPIEGVTEVSVARVVPSVPQSRTSLVLTLHADTMSPFVWTLRYPDPSKTGFTAIVPFGSSEMVHTAPLVSSHA